VQQQSRAPLPDPIIKRYWANPDGRPGSPRREAKKSPTQVNIQQSCNVFGSTYKLTAHGVPSIPKRANPNETQHCARSLASQSHAIKLWAAKEHPGSACTVRPQQALRSSQLTRKAARLHPAHKPEENINRHASTHRYRQIDRDKKRDRNKRIHPRTHTQAQFTHQTPGAVPSPR
jgi:hypothetical protein